MPVDWKFPWPCRICGRAAYPQIGAASAAFADCHDGDLQIGERMCLALAVVAGAQNAIEEHRPAMAFPGPES